MSAALMEQRPQVLSRALEGDSDSFTRLIEPLLDPAYRLAAVMLADRTAAEDAVQEAAVKAWRKLRQLRGEEGSLRPWFLSIVATEGRVAGRGRWWWFLKFAEVREPESEAPENSYTDLRRALLRLSPDERL